MGKDTNKIVFTHATYRQCVRDYVIERLQQDDVGIPNPKITLIELNVDRKKRLNAIYQRNKKLAEAGQPTLEDQMRSMGWNIKGAMNRKTFKKFYTKYLEVPFEHQKECKSSEEAIVRFVDATDRDVTCLDKLDNALGLTRPSNLPYLDMCDRINDLNERRDQKYATLTIMNPAA